MPWASEKTEHEGGELQLSCFGLHAKATRQLTLL